MPKSLSPGTLQLYFAFVYWVYFICRDAPAIIHTVYESIFLAQTWFSLQRIFNAFPVSVLMCFVLQMPIPTSCSATTWVFRIGT